MSITSPTFTQGAVLYASDLDEAYATLTTEINRLAALPHNSQNLAKNLIINGDFSRWQYATSQTTSGYGSDDRFTNLNTGSTKVASQQSFAIGQTLVTNNPKFYSRTVVTSVANAANNCLKEHRIEDVTKLSGETVTLQFWGSVGSDKNIAVEFEQNFGTGGSPSTAVDEIGVTTVALTSTFQLITVTVTMPSVSGKTLGTDGNDYTAIKIWFDAGANFDLNTNSLGQQSGTFNIANMQLEISATATDFEYVTPADQLARCQRYFERRSGAGMFALGRAFNSTFADSYLNYSTVKRSIPTITASSTTGITATGSGAAIASTGVSTSSVKPDSAQLSITVASGLVAGEGLVMALVTSQYIDIDAEL